MRATAVVVALLVSLNSAGAQFDGAEADLKAGRYAEARRKLAPAAQAGDATAQYLLAGTYLEGLATTKDPREGVRWLTKSADQGYPRALSLLGSMYLSGTNVPRDVDHGATLIRAAADKGDPRGLHNLGVMHRDGISVARDRREAARLFRLAADAGHSDAQYNLARLAYDDRDFRTAAYWYDKAGQQGDLEALFNLGRMYYYGEGVAIDYGRARELFLQCADKSRFQPGARGVRAMDMLGFIYRDGKGVPSDGIEAYKWHMLAASQGHPTAPRNMEYVGRQLSEAQRQEGRARAEKFARDGNQP